MPRGENVSGVFDCRKTSIAKACRAAAIPLFSPHDLRHRRISLLHLRGVPWARIGEFVGQRSLSVTADTYSHVLADETEVDYGALLESGQTARYRRTHRRTFRPGRCRLAGGFESSRGHRPSGPS